MDWPEFYFRKKKKQIRAGIDVDWALVAGEFETTVILARCAHSGGVATRTVLQSYSSDRGCSTTVNTAYDALMDILVFNLDVVADLESCLV